MVEARRAPRRSRRAGFTFSEVAIVLAFVSFFAVFMSSALLTANAVNNETYFESEVLQVTSRLMNDLQQELSQAADYRSIDGTTPASAPYTAAPRWCTEFRFHHGQDADGNLALEPGVWDLRGQSSTWQADFSYQTTFVTEGALNETVARVDINGDGDALDTAVPVGRLHLQLRNAANGTVSVGSGAVREKVFGGLGSRTRIVREAYAGGVAVRMFSTPPTTATPAPGNLAVPVLAATGGQPGQGDDTAVQVNVTIVHDPYPSAGGEKAIQIFRLSRIVARR